MLIRSITMLPAILSVLLASSVAASPGPPPPPYVDEARKILVATPEPPSDAIASLFADDVTVWQNGEIVARGKAAWLAWRGKEAGDYYGTHWGYSEGWSRNAEQAGGNLLVIDTFDDFDQRRHDAHFLVDHRFKTRSILYAFGKDEHIHKVLISRVEGSWEPLPR